MKDKIRRLTANGFQSHLKTVIEFDDGFNAIIGPTGSGKSAAMRLIRWILFNETPDSGFVTVGEDLCEGGILFASGKEIIRGRNKKENYYILKMPGKEDINMTGFGDQPIDEVLNFHGIKPIRIGKEDVFITMHGQHDKPFFLMESAPDKAKVIGSLARTDVVDLAISNLAADIKRDQTRYSKLNSDIKTQEELLEKYQDIDDRKSDLVLIQGKMDVIQENNRLALQAEDSSDRLGNLSSQYKKLKKMIGRQDSIDRALDVMERIKIKAQRINAVKNTSDNMSDNIRKINRCNSTIDKITDEDIAAVSSALDFLSKNKKITEQLLSIRTELHDNVERVEHCMKIRESEQSIQKAQETLRSLVIQDSKLKSFVSSSANFLSEVSRFYKGTEIINQREEAVDFAKKEVRDEIEENPICPICKSDLRERKEAVLNV